MAISPLDLSRVSAPTRVMAIEEAYVPHATQAQQRSRQPCARAVAAVKHQVAAWRQCRKQRLPVRQVDRAGHVPFVELAARPDVDDNEPAANRTLRFELVRRHVQSPASSMTIHQRSSFFMK